MRISIFILSLYVPTVTAAVIFQDSFESGDFAATQNGFEWQLRSNACGNGGSAPTNGSDPMVISNGQSIGGGSPAPNAKSGTKAALFAFQGDGDPYMTNCGGGVNNSWKELAFRIGGQYPDLWVKFNLYWPSGYTVADRPFANNKTFVVSNSDGVHGSATTLHVMLTRWPDTYSGLQNTTDSSGLNYGPAGGEYSVIQLKINNAQQGHDHPGNNYYGSTSDAIPIVNIGEDLGRWNEYIYHVRLSSCSSCNDGLVEVWKNGIKGLSKVGINNFNSDGKNYIDDGYLLGYDTSGHTVRTDVYMDDVVFSTTPITPGGGTTDTQAPTVPTGLSATSISSSQINLSWAASTDNVGVTGYPIERCAGSGCVNFVQMASPSGTSFSDSGLSPNTLYRYRVRATDAAGNLSGYSSIAEATTQNGPLILGNNAIGSFTDGADSNNISAVRFTTGATAGAVTSMSIYIASPVDNAPNNQYSMAIYSDNAGNASTKLAQTANGTLTGNSWNTLPITVTLQPNTTYWLCYNTNGSTGSVNNFKYDTGTSGQMAWYSAFSFGNWPSALGTKSGSNTNKISIYATFGNNPPTIQPITSATISNTQ